VPLYSFPIASATRSPRARAVRPAGRGPVAPHLGRTAADRCRRPRGRPYPPCAGARHRV